MDEFVLVLEDDADIRDAVVELLTEAGYAVRAASTLSEARAICDRFLPAVLIADFQLPDGSSDELLRELARAGAAVPTVMMTAAAAGRQIAAELSVEFIGKPFSVDELLEITARLAARDIAAAGG